jgi:hypothetical protein
MPGAVVGMIIGVLSLLYAGFCFTSFRFLSDDEAIDAAIEEVIKTGVHIIETPSGGHTTFVPERQVKYANRDEFRRLNPDCCEIVPHDPFWVTLRDQLFGRAAKSVHVRYMARYINEFGGTSQMEAGWQRAISGCGRVLNTGH